VTSAGRGPGVRFPPPILFVAGFAAAWYLDTRLEFVIDGTGPGPVQTAIGLLMLAGGLLMMAWGMKTFVYHRTPIVPISRARALVRSGPYRFSRNPMYVGLTSAYLGGALVTNMAWPLVLLPFVLVALVSFVIRKEEAYLQSEFGADYDLYCRQVRRWL
jgi:protein-S-isoprenylcysteine O-methyltransferase Ste14